VPSVRNRVQTPDNARGTCLACQNTVSHTSRAAQRSTARVVLPKQQRQRGRSQTQYRTTLGDLNRASAALALRTAQTHARISNQNSPLDSPQKIRPPPARTYESGGVIFAARVQPRTACRRNRLRMRGVSDLGLDEDGDASHGNAGRSSRNQSPPSAGGRDIAVARGESFLAALCFLLLLTRGSFGGGQRVYDRWAVLCDGGWRVAEFVLGLPPCGWEVVAESWAAAALLRGQNGILRRWQPLTGLTNVVSHISSPQKKIIYFSDHSATGYTLDTSFELMMICIC
jgi:hypothetical protein